MASAALGKELECSICLNLYTDPVTLRCGHNFCRVCIDQVLNTQEGSGVYSCPECRGEFQERPTLQKNITLCNVVENFLSTHKDEAVIFCTYCVDSPVPAVKSCLMCEASLCDKHLKVHIKAGEHVLTEPRTSLENKKCPIHKEVLKYYCTEDASCICVSCSLAGEHRGHQVEVLDEASEKKKKQLRNVLQKLIKKREKTEERVRSLEERRRKEREKSSGKADRVTALFIDMRRRLDDLEKRILNEISRQEKSLSDIIQKLEIKKDELFRKMRDIEELCNMTDPLTVLQGPDTGDLCDPEEEGGDEDTDDLCDPEEEGGDEDTDDLYDAEEEASDEDTGDLYDAEEEASDEDTGDLCDPEEEEVDEDTGDLCDPEEEEGDEDTGEHDGGDEDTGGHDGGDRGLELISRTLHTLSDIIRGVNVTFYVQDPADILLDVNTANNYLLISDDLKSVTETETEQNRPDTAERFQDYPQVMSSRGFSSGRHYWDVEVDISEDWRVGMCYSSIDRRGEQSVIGDNNKSWGLDKEEDNNNPYSVIHDSEEIQLPHQISSDRIRVYLDYEAGQLSFYELCDPIRHLHTFTTTFTEPLHAVLWVLGSIKISGGGAAVRKSS